MLSNTKLRKLAAAVRRQHPEGRTFTKKEARDAVVHYRLYRYEGAFLREDSWRAVEDLLAS
ncbi:MAG: hypothetical protein Q4G46_00145 [Propionibacteriaceae bacterium]|nr:hypothetical protein [Propionibacteriaceae bacterium]